MKIGILALQGAFIEHADCVQQLGADCVLIRRLSHFTDDIDGLILPGGESTVQGKLLKEEGLFEHIKEAIINGMPVFGTCAGMILLAKKLANDSRVHLGLFDGVVKRNAYGRQLGSFIVKEQFANLKDFPMTFIRAPYFESVGDSVEVLATVNEKIVAAKQNNMLCTSFHPELKNDLRVHKYFLDMIKK